MDMPRPVRCDALLPKLVTGAVRCCGLALAPVALWLAGCATPISMGRSPLRPVEVRAQIVRLLPTALPDRPGGDYELWVIPAGQKPVSLGVMPAAAPLRRHLSDQLAALMVRGAALAVTPETRGGSPTGQPQGTPIASGALA